MKLNPRRMMKNPVMFLVEVGARAHDAAPASGCRARRLSLSNPDHALALGHGALREFRRSRGRRAREGAGRRVAESEDRHRRAQASIEPGTRSTSRPRSFAKATSSSSKRIEIIPGDGTVIEGIASVNESAITGESAPVIREAGGDRSAVTGGTMVLSDRIVVEITSESGTDASSTG